MHLQFTLTGSGLILFGFLAQYVMGEEELAKFFFLASALFLGMSLGTSWDDR